MTGVDVCKWRTCEEKCKEYNIKLKVWSDKFELEFPNKMGSNSFLTVEQLYYFLNGFEWGISYNKLSDRGISYNKLKGKK